MPSAYHLKESSMAIREIIGRIIYRPLDRKKLIILYFKKKL